MAFMRIGRYGFGPLKALLFDKDGTIASSEMFLLRQAQARVMCCLQHVEDTQRPQLQQLLCRAYGLIEAGNGAGLVLDPGGATAVASAAENLISTATCLAQAGLNWSEALTVARSAHRQAADEQYRSRAQLTPPLPGIVEVLHWADQLGLMCGVISGDCRQGIEAFLKHWDLSPMIKIYRGADEWPAKPAPEAVAALCAALGVTAEQCVLCGDSGNDLAMGRAAGVGAVVGYSGGWTVPPDLKGFDAVMDNWEMLKLTKTDS